MDPIDIIDDQRSAEEKSIDSLCNLQDRLRHFAVDALFIVVTFALEWRVVASDYFGVHFRDHPNRFFTILIIYAFIYYLFLETVFGKTLGKFFNRTKVIGTDNLKPHFKAVLIRSLLRFIPFTFLTVLTPIKKTLHDHFSGTRTVRIK